jgi:perosamine synthetase
VNRPIPAVPMPLGWRDAIAASKAGRAARSQFEEACRVYHSAQRAFAVSSGRAALWLALRAVGRHSPNRRKVVLPAYTCPTVGRAVLAAGLGGVCIDVDPGHFNLRVEQVAEALDEETLAVVAPHMFGTPCDVADLTLLCARKGVVLIEDVAQACGARLQGQGVGTFGDLAFLSLGRSKNLRGYKGGVLLVNRADLVSAVEEQAAALPEELAINWPAVGKQLAISLLSAPTAWNMAKRLPFLRIGAEDQDFDPHPTRLGPWEAELGMRALARVDEYNSRRTHLARVMETELSSLAEVHVQREPVGAESAHVRLATRLDATSTRRDAIVSYLQGRGIDARAFYTRPIYGYDWWQPAPEQAPCPEAERLVKTNLVLPLYYGMNDDQARSVARSLGEALMT